MSISDELKNYSDIRRHTTPSAFTAALAFISWHNRLTFTAMLEPWQALVVAMACEQRPIEGLQFQAVKNWLEKTATPVPESLEECRERAGALLQHLISSNE